MLHTSAPPRASPPFFAARNAQRVTYSIRKLPDSQVAVLEEPQLNEAFIINLNPPISEAVQEILHHPSIPGSQST
jgi:hypothetical protein